MYIVAPFNGNSRELRKLFAKGLKTRIFLRVSAAKILGGAGRSSAVFALFKRTRNFA